MLCYYLHSKIALRSALIATCCFLAVFAALPAAAQPRAATVNSFNGRILVVPSSQPVPSQTQLGSMSQAGAPAILTYSGDVSVVSSSRPIHPLVQLGNAAPDSYRIVTKFGAYATLTLPDGSQISIREMSILELNGFVWDKRTNLRGMLMSLYAGSVRVSLSQVYQEQESFFEIKTPNALLSLHFSQPDVEVIYAPSPLENMLALLEEGERIEEEEEETLWKEVLAARKENVLRRQREQAALAQTVAIQSEGTAVLPVEAAQIGLQEALAQIGLIQSEGDALLQARLLQRDEELTSRVAQAAAVQVADASTSGLVLPDSGGPPVNIDLEQWLADGLITGEDDMGKGTTCVFAYTVSVSFMNRITREIRTIQHGQRAVVRGRGITITVLNGNPMQNDPPRNIGTIFEFESLGQMPSLDKADASSPWLFPGSTGRPGSSGNRPRPHDIEIIIDE